MRRLIGSLLMLVLLSSVLLESLPTSNVSGEAEVKPSKGWGMFFGTTGNVNITITEEGTAVRVEVPREFLDGVIPKSKRQTVNDTSFIKSDISNDYYYYSVIDQSEYYPYDANAPYSIEIQKPPAYPPPSCMPIYSNFTLPRFILLERLKAPSISGVYNFTVYIAKNLDSNFKPIFPPTPSKVLKIKVSMREDPGCIQGFIIDDKAKKYILAKGVVYAIEINTGQMGRGFVNSTTGFFNVTGLYAGRYRLEGSAGYFPDTGYAYAPTTSGPTYPVEKGTRTDVYNFSLNRGCIINGSITYTDQLGNALKPLDSPYLKALNYPGLNYTVEAYDTSNKIVASRTYKSENIQTEIYKLILRNGTRHVGYPALGTEYAGFGPGTYLIKIWVYGFTYPATQVKIVTLARHGDWVFVGDSRLPYGAVVTGRIILKTAPSAPIETPRQAEVRTFGSSTGTLFGGNILIQMYDRAGSLKGLTILNRTLPSGFVTYSDYSTGDQTPLLKFYVLGFSEHYNRTYSSAWMVGSIPGPSPWDYGIEAGTYYLRVWIRGYVQEAVQEFVLAPGSNQTLGIELRRGGSIEVTIRSSVVRPATRQPQSPLKWRFYEFCPPARLRIYFYASSGMEAGYAETVLRPGMLGVSNESATLDFTGHNWSVDDIIIRGFIPNALRADTYSVRAFTCGYVQDMLVSASISLSPFSSTHIRTAFPLLAGGSIRGSVSFAMNGILLGLTETVTVRTQVTLAGSLKGVSVVDVTAGSRAFDFQTWGFYGRGHFFYVDPDGVRWKDYGLDTGMYKVLIPNFGYDRMFMQNIDITAGIQELGWETAVFYTIERMIRVTGSVKGYDKDHFPVPLVWASAASNSYVSYSYDGDFRMHMPAGSYTIKFTCPGYTETSRTVTTSDTASLEVTLEQSGAPFP